MTSLKSKHERLLRAALKCFRPPPKLNVCEWADTYRYLSSDNSPEPGKYRSDRAPYQREIQAVISDPAVERVTCMMSSQVGKTLITENVIGYYTHQDPSPILMLQYSIEMAEDFSKGRLDPMIRDTPALRRLFSTKSRDGNNTLLYKKFPGGLLKLAGTNSPASLASKPIRVLILDEVDRYETSSGKEGSPVDLAEKRTTNFHNRKIIAISTPLIKGRSKIESLYLQSDQRKFHLPCPHCRELIVLEFKQLHWVNGDPETAAYRCQKCEALIDEADKFEMLRQGQWIATAPFKGHAGFHISELYSPWSSWSRIAAAFLKAKDNPEELKVFVNTTLGETWEQRGDAPEWRRVYDRREPYPIGKVPKGGLFLTCAADVQKDRLEVEVKAWGRGKENWSIDYLVFPGDTSTPAPWEKLRELVARPFEHESGADLRIVLTAVDSGFNTQKVYEFVRGFPPSIMRATKGQSGLQVFVAQPSAVDLTLSDGKKIRRGMRVWGIGHDLIKADFYGLLRVPRPTDEELLISGGKFPPGFSHFPEYGEEYFRQLTAEALVERKVRDHTRHEWVKIYERNEALDLHVLNRAAATMIGIDRFSERNWLELERAISKTPRRPEDQKK